MICVGASGGLEQSKSSEKTAGESQWSDSGPEEDSWVSATQRLSQTAVHHAGQGLLKSLSSHFYEWYFLLPFAGTLPHRFVG